MRRACGDERTQGGLYMCCGFSPFGSPWHKFMLDPARPTQFGTLRAPLLVWRPLMKPTSDGMGWEEITGGLAEILAKRYPALRVDHGKLKIADVVIGVGKEFYPYVPDFMEEVAEMGVSKRVPSNFEVKNLLSYRVIHDEISDGSRMILVHPNAIPEFEYTVRYDSNLCHLRGPEGEKGEEHECSFNLWPLSGLGSFPPKHERAVTAHLEHERADGKTAQYVPAFTANIPCGVEYWDFLPLDPRVDDPQATGDDRPYGEGAFAAFYITHFECVRKEESQVDISEIEEQFAGLDWDFRVVPE